MMKRFKQWLYSRFLPAWCKDDLTAFNTKLLSENARLIQENERLTAYIDGMETAIRARARITIRNEVSK